MNMLFTPQRNPCLQAFTWGACSPAENLEGDAMRSELLGTAPSAQKRNSQMEREGSVAHGCMLVRNCTPCRGVLFSLNMAVCFPDSGNTRPWK
jgi:hypothetical protein